MQPLTRIVEYPLDDGRRIRTPYLAFADFGPSRSAGRSDMLVDTTLSLDTYRRFGTGCQGRSPQLFRLACGLRNQDPAALTLLDEKNRMHVKIAMFVAASNTRD